MRHERAIGELERTRANLLQVGTVAEADYAKARVRVLIGGLTSAWLPWITARAGGDRTWAAPEVSEQVLVACPDGDPANGVVVGAIYQQAHAAPADNADITRTEYSDGAIVEYDRGAHKLIATLPGGGAIEATAPGGVEVTAAAGVDVIAPGEVTIVGNVRITGGLWVGVTTGAACTLTGDIELEGNLNATGNLDAGGDVTAAGDVTAGTVSLQGHVHTGVVPGGGLSGPPEGSGLPGSGEPEGGWQTGEEDPVALDALDDLIGELGDAAYLDVGTTDGTVAAGDHVHATAHYAPTALTVTYGTLDSGTYATLAAQDGVSVAISEAAGANALQLELTFAGVGSFSSIVLYGRYAGSSAHQLAVESWNYSHSAWDIHGYLSFTAEPGWHHFAVSDSAEHVSSGAAKVRLRHLQSANTGHDLYLDYVSLDAAAGAVVLAHAELTGRSVPEAHPASAITNTPSGVLSAAATDVQAALGELAALAPVVLFRVAGDDATTQTLTSGVEAVVLGSGYGALAGTVTLDSTQGTWDAATGIYTYTGTRPRLAVVNGSVGFAGAGNATRLYASLNVGGTKAAFFDASVALGATASMAGARGVVLTTGTTVKLIAYAAVTSGTPLVAKWAAQTSLSVVAY
jgi:phage baseplate assembly protein V